MEAWTHGSSLPIIRRQCVFQAFSVPGAEQLQKLLSLGSQGYMFSKNSSKPNDNTQGTKLRKKLRKMLFLWVRVSFRAIRSARHLPSQLRDALLQKCRAGLGFARAWTERRRHTANLCPMILDFRGVDSSRILLLRGGILMSIGNLPESLSQAILAARF